MQIMPEIIRGVNRMFRAPAIMAGQETVPQSWHLLLPVQAGPR